MPMVSPPGRLKVAVVRKHVCPPASRAGTETTMARFCTALAAGGTLRYLSQLRHIYVGRVRRGERIRPLSADAKARVIRENGQLRGEATRDTSRNYQPLRRPAIVHHHRGQVS